MHSQMVSLGDFEGSGIGDRASLDDLFQLDTTLPLQNLKLMRGEEKGWKEKEENFQSLYEMLADDVNAVKVKEDFLDVFEPVLKQLQFGDNTTGKSSSNMKGEGSGKEHVNGERGALLNLRSENGPEKNLLFFITCILVRLLALLDEQVSACHERS